MNFLKIGFCLALISVVAVGCGKGDDSNNGDGTDAGADTSDAVESDTPGESGFTLGVEPSPVDVRRDAEASVTISIARGSEFEDAVDVSAVALPTGVTVSDATVAASSDSVELTIEASADAQLGTHQVTVEATSGELEESAALELGVYDSPTLVSTEPSAHAFTVDAGAMISATFDQPMAAADQDSFRVFSNRRGLLDGSYGGEGTATLTFEPADDFLPGEELSVSLTSELSVPQGLALEAPVVFSFRAASSEPSSGTFTEDFKDLRDAEINVIDVSIVDMDGDRNLDVFASGRGGLMFCRNNGGEPPAFDCTKIDTLENRQHHVVADFDADSQPDAIVETPSSGNDNRYQHLCLTGPGAPPSIDCQSTDLLDGDWMDDAAVGDLDQDGDIDLLTATRTPEVGTTTIKRTDDVCFNNGGSPPQFNCQPIDEETTYGIDAELADLDNDGDLDAVLTGYDSAKICENGGGQPVGFSCGDMPEMEDEEIAIGDMNGDGAVDIVGGDLLCLNQDPSTMSFQCSDIVNLSSIDGQLELADIAGDGDLDMLRGSDGSGVGVCKNGGGEPPSITCDYLDTMQADNSVDIGDLDSDGDLDLISTSYDPRFFYGLQ